MAKQEMKEPSVQIKKDRRMLICQLTEDEVAQAANELAKYVEDCRAIEDELTSVKASYKSKSEQCKANINAKARLVRDKREPRMVDVEEQYNYTECTVTIIRLDTSEIIESRKMTGDEKQLRLDGFSGE